jgi:ABC-type antimicrobial peptide transport system permease subunit
MVKIKRGEEQSTIAALEKVYNSRTPGLSFDYGFVDDDYNALYVSEQRVSLLSGYFAILAILISALGLFGLSAFTAECRRKEIGIRKILGSSEYGIVLLLSEEFSKIILTAILIAIPVSFLVTRNWLSGFAYSIPLQWWFFVAAALMAVIIPLLAVVIQTVKASIVSPAQSLKEE